MKKYIKTILYFLLNLLPSREKKNQAIILMYHSISDSKNFFSVAPKEFERQIEWLIEKKYNIVSLEKLLEFLKNKSIPPRTVVITFDDGYQDNYLTAYPLLKKFKIPATIFISTDMVSTSVMAKNEEEFKILDWSELGVMKESNLVEIGAHGQTHKKLTHLSPKEVEDELKQSKKILEEKTKSEVEFLAYPSGKFNSEIKLVAGKYYKLALTVEPGAVTLDSEPMELKRNSIDSQVGFSQFKYVIKHGRR